MSKIIIGCDPDSSKSGFAFYVDGDLERLECMPLIDFYNTIEHIKSEVGKDNIELHIENVKGVSGIFAQRIMGQGKAIALKMAQSVGMCKQVQTEVERIAEHFGIKIVRHQVSKMWKKDKSKFEELTGWEKQSNEDSRSAAYFGYLGLTRSK